MIYDSWSWKLEALIVASGLTAVLCLMLTFTAVREYQLRLDGWVRVDGRFKTVGMVNYRFDWPAGEDHDALTAWVREAFSHDGAEINLPEGTRTYVQRRSLPNITLLPKT